MGRQVGGAIAGVVVEKRPIPHLCAQLPHLRLHVSLHHLTDLQSARLVRFVVSPTHAPQATSEVGERGRRHGHGEQCSQHTASKQFFQSLDLELSMCTHGALRYTCERSKHLNDNRIYRSIGVYSNAT